MFKHFKKSFKIFLKCPQDHVNLSPGSWYQVVHQTLNLSRYSVLHFFLSNQCNFWYVALFYIFVQHIFPLKSNHYLAFYF